MDGFSSRSRLLARRRKSRAAAAGGSADTGSSTASRKAELHRGTALKYIPGLVNIQKAIENCHRNS